MGTETKGEYQIEDLEMPIYVHDLHLTLPDRDP